MWSTPPGASRATAHDRGMLRAAALLCFFGFCRSGEITVLSASAYDERVHLAWGDVAVVKGSASMVRIHLKRSKCDQLGRGVDIFVGRTHSELCPVSATLHYVGLRGPTPGPFFIFADRSPLTKFKFVARLREALTSLGLRSCDYAGHSFRIGAATAAAQAGLEDSVIQSLGRWSSDAFLRYIRMPGEQLALYSGRFGTGGAH